MGDVYAIYIRRSDKGEDDAEVSDHIQQETCLRRVPDGEPVEYFRDSGGDRRKNSGGTTDRAQYQRMLSWLRDDRLAAIVSYDDSRLNRNAENALSLYRECLALGVPIVTGVVPAEAVFSPEGELTYGITAVVAANQRAVSKKNAKERAERAWSNAEPHGADPFGYRTVKAWDERRRKFSVVRPRRWEVVPDEAAIVRRVFLELATISSHDIAERLNAEGMWRRGKPWTRDTVKDLMGRDRVYLGYLVRGRDGRAVERLGTHPPIIDETIYAAYREGIARRFRSGRRPRKHRAYPLSGRLFHDCGTRLQGHPRVSRGQEWRYYVCRVCRMSVPAQDAERVVLGAITTMRVPATAVERAREVLAERLRLPKTDVLDDGRQRLLRRLAALRSQHEWGHIDDAEYTKKTRETNTMLATMPSADRMVSFDQHRDVIETMAANIDAASGAQLTEAVARITDHIVARGRTVTGDDITWNGAFLPFFEPVVGAPPDGFEPPTQALGRPRSIH